MTYWDKASQEHPQPQKDGNVSPIDENGWRPLSEAPKDGTLILGWSENWTEYHLIRWEESEGGWCEGTWCFSYPPEFWQPLPKPPSNPFNALLPEPVE